MFRVLSACPFIGMKCTATRSLAVALRLTAFSSPRNVRHGGAPGRGKIDGVQSHFTLRRQDGRR